MKKTLFSYFLSKQNAIFIFCFFILVPKNKADDLKIDFDENCKNAYNKIIALELKNAATFIALEKTEHPNNLATAYLEYASDFMLFFVEEKNVDFKLLDKQFETRLKQIEKVNDNSPYKKYLLAQMNLEMCIANGKMGNYFTAFFEVRRANNLLKENQKKFPSFIPNKKGLGLIHCLIGTIPDNYKWGANLFGFEGNLEQGMNELWEVKNATDKTDFYCKAEINFIYVYGLLYMQNDKKNSWLIAKKLWDENPENKLYCFLAANVAQNTAKNEEAISILNQQPKDEAHLNFDYLNYMMGLAMLRKLDPSATTYFLKFLKANDRRNFVKDGYQKLAWSYLLNNDLTNYKIALQNCKTFGNTVVDADKQALREVNNNEQPVLILLKARLLCDGGYYKEAIDLLSGHKMDEFKNKKDQVEFVYRVGRIYHDWGFNEKAIPYYFTAIDDGKDLPQHFACNAALNMGLIYEQKGDKPNAEKYFKMCIASKNTDFKQGLEQKAKTGLERLKK